MLPLLKFAAAKGQEIFKHEAVDVLAKKFHLSDNELAVLLPSGRSGLFAGRVGWASTYLKQAGLLAATRRGYFQITDEGKKVIQNAPPTINNKYLRQYPTFRDFERRSKKEPQGENGGETNDPTLTPLEVAESAHESLRNELAADLLSKLKESSPSFFEQIVVDLLVQMGYGGSRHDAAKAVGRSGDGGIDGIIKEDKLGLDVVYIQAKRWDANTVGRPAIQQFAGALLAQKASKGIFITTSSFSDDAKKYASQISTRIILIDGDQLTKLMIEHDVGVSTVSLYPVKKIDSDYFDEEV